MSKITIQVHQDICIGAASCADLAPAVFQLNHDNQAVVIADGAEQPMLTLEINPDALKRVLAAARSCPTVAIVVTDESGASLV